MKSVSTYAAKTHFPRLLEEVSKGESFTITKHGLPVAMLVPIEPLLRSSPSDLVDEVKRFKRIKLPKGTSIKNLIDEGRMSCRKQKEILKLFGKLNLDPTYHYKSLRNLR